MNIGMICMYVYRHMLAFRTRIALPALEGQDRLVLGIALGS